MRILVISDTHGNYAATCMAADEAGPVDLLIHLGDVAEDTWAVEAVAGCPIISVAGNCDPPGADVPREIRREFAGVPFLLTHGDSYQVKAGLSGLHLRAVQTNSRVALYGHTHQAAINEIDGIWLINPGTLHAASQTRTYALVDIDNGAIRAAIFSLDPVTGEASSRSRNCGKPSCSPHPERPSRGRKRSGSRPA